MDLRPAGKATVSTRLSKGVGSPVARLIHGTPVPVDGDLQEAVMDQSA